jgi:hypothetical protein
MPAKTESRTARYLAAAIGAGDALGRYLERSRFSWLPQYCYLAAAQIDLAIPALGLVGAHPFNGQVNRMAIFRDIVDICDIATLVETGTCRGATTEYMARHFRGKIYSSEIDQRYFEYAKARLKDFDAVELQLMDSRRLLEKLFREAALAGGAVFYYLDAHWNKDLPLLEEIELILNSDVPSVVMVDDFEVPFDQGFGFDTYGEGRKLCLSMLSGFRDRLPYIYFPALPAAADSGPRRGAVIFATTPGLDAKLAALASLRRATGQDWGCYDQAESGVTA